MKVREGQIWKDEFGDLLYIEECGIDSVEVIEINEQFNNFYGYQKSIDDFPRDKKLVENAENGRIIVKKLCEILHSFYKD